MPPEGQMIAFVHIRKTAGTSMKFILRNSFGIYHCDARKIKADIFHKKHLDFAKKIFPRIDCISGHSILEPTTHLAGEGRYFTFLREPIMRTISDYQDNYVRGKHIQTLEHFLSKEIQRNKQVKMIAGSEDLNKAKQLLKEEYFFVGITEDFDNSVKLLNLLLHNKLNLDYYKTVYAKDNSLKGRLVQDPQAMAILKEANGLDLELYDFAQKEIYEPMKEKYKDAIAKMGSGRPYKTPLHFKFLMSKFFNKYVFRQLVKLKRIS